MSIKKKYAQSVTGSNLKDDGYNPATNHLIAIATSPVHLASHLFRLKYCNDATVYANLLSLWTDRLGVLAGRHKWPTHISPSVIAEKSIHYWTNHLCHTCRGRGVNPRINKHGGLEVECAPCGGTGKRDIIENNRIRQYVVDAVSALDDMERHAEYEAQKKLKIHAI